MTALHPSTTAIQGSSPMPTCNARRWPLPRGQSRLPRQRRESLPDIAGSEHMHLCGRDRQPLRRWRKKTQAVEERRNRLDQHPRLFHAPLPKQPSHREQHRLFRHIDTLIAAPQTMLQCFDARVREMPCIEIQPLNAGTDARLDSNQRPLYCQPSVLPLNCPGAQACMIGQKRLAQRRIVGRLVRS